MTVLHFLFSLLSSCVWHTMSTALDNCSVTDYALEIVFVQDPSGKFGDLPTRQMSEILRKLDEEFSEGRYGYVTSAAVNLDSSGSQAFKKWSPLTGDRNQLLRRISAISDCNSCSGSPRDTGPPPSMIAMAAAVISNEMEWSTTELNRSFKRVVKIVTVFTDEDQLHAASNQHLRIPDAQFGIENATHVNIGKELNSNDVYTLGMLKGTGHVSWLSHITTMQVPNVVRAVGSGTMGDSIAAGIKEIICQHVVEEHKAEPLQRELGRRNPEPAQEVQEFHPPEPPQEPIDFPHPGLA